MPLAATDRNRQAYASRWVAFDYRRASGLTTPELAIVRRLGDHIGTRRLLDIGIGTGRTTEVLRPLAGGYVGIDYSAQMVKQARKRFPEADIRQADARNMAEIGHGSFDIAWFSFNGIDSLSHDDRIEALSEMRRMLKPGGTLIFSSHNRDWKDLGAKEEAPRLDWTLHPGKLGYRLFRYARSMQNIRSLQNAGEETSEYAIRNDAAHDYSLLQYSIGLPAQVKQLERLGLVCQAALDDNGEELPLDGPHTISSSLYYIATAHGPGDRRPT